MYEFWDTNIVLKFARQNLLHQTTANVLISVVVEGELEAISLRNRWGVQKRKSLDTFLSTVPIIEITSEIAKTYAKIDAYSQGLLDSTPLPKGMSARNMGKNDLWIAATALFFNANLRSGDSDFDHLANLGIKLIKI